MAIPSSTLASVMHRVCRGRDRPSEGSRVALGFSTVETPAIDALDHAIIAELRNDARVSWRELGERVGLGPTATADRVRRLEQLGVVRGYHADVDLSALGMGLRAITELRLTSDTPYEQFEATLRSHTRGPARVPRHREPGLRADAGLSGRGDPRSPPVDLADRGRRVGELHADPAARRRPLQLNDQRWTGTAGAAVACPTASVSPTVARTVSSRDCAASHSASSAPTFDSAASWAAASSRTFWWSS